MSRETVSVITRHDYYEGGRLSRVIEMVRNKATARKRALFLRKNAPSVHITYTVEHGIPVVENPFEVSDE